MTDELSQELEQFRNRVRSDETTVSEIREWLFFKGNRTLIAALGGLSVFVLLFALQSTGSISFRYSSGMTRLSTGIVAGEFSLLTIVLSINQLIISQETGPADKIQQRMDGMMGFRERFERAVGVGTTPSEPVEMLHVLADSTLSEIRNLESTTSEITERELRSVIAEYCELTESNIQKLEQKLTESDTGAFNALSSSITDNYGWHAHLARRIQNEYGDSLSEEAHESLDAMIELMKVFSISRAHFKTIYTRRELGRASRLILAVGVPGLLSGVILNTMYGPSGATAIPESLVPPVAVLLITIACLPVCLLASYILRTATVARRTANIGPMALNKDSRIDTKDNGSSDSPASSSEATSD